MRVGIFDQVQFLDRQQMSWSDSLREVVDAALPSMGGRSWLVVSHGKEREGIEVGNHPCLSGEKGVTVAKVIFCMTLILPLLFFIAKLSLRPLFNEIDVREKLRWGAPFDLEAREGQEIVRRVRGGEVDFRGGYGSIRCIVNQAERLLEESILLKKYLLASGETALTLPPLRLEEIEGRSVFLEYLLKRSEDGVDEERAVEELGRLIAARGYREISYDSLPVTKQMGNYFLILEPTALLASQEPLDPSQGFTEFAQTLPFPLLKAACRGARSVGIEFPAEVRRQMLLPFLGRLKEGSNKILAECSNVPLSDSSGLSMNSLAVILRDKIFSAAKKGLRQIDASSSFLRKYAPSYSPEMVQILKLFQEKGLLKSFVIEERQGVIQTLFFTLF